MQFCIKAEQESDGHWKAAVTNMPGVLAHGDTKEHAQANVYALALRVIADEIEKSKSAPKSINVEAQSA